MVGISRILSRPTAKPYRSKDVQYSQENPPSFNDDGHLTFSEDDIENPKEWSSARRSFITICAVLLVVNATFASASPSGCLESISEHFGVSTIVSGLNITLFLLGYCAGPLIFAPMSEFYGRRPIFYITFLLYIAFNFLCAFAPNFGALLVGRFLTGTFVSAPLSNAPGVLADLWQPLERGNAMAGFALMVWAGPALGPVISGFLQLTKGVDAWRWNFYVLLMLGGFTVPFLLAIPETYAPVILYHKAQRIRKAKLPGYEEIKAPIETTDRSLVSLYKVALTRPWIILFDPISFLCAIYMSVVYLLLYMLFAIYRMLPPAPPPLKSLNSGHYTNIYATAIVFEGKRGWSAGVGELPLLGLICGAFLGSLVMLWDTQHQNKIQKNGTKPIPEHRLRTALFGGPCLALAMFWFGWTANFNYVHWIVPTIAGCFAAASMLLIFVSFLNYLVDAYLMFAASAIAANTVARSAAGSAAPLFTDQMFTALGVGGGSSLIGGVAVLLACIPFLFYKYGESIRIKSRFAPTGPTKQPDKVDEAEKGAVRGRHDSGDGGLIDEEGPENTSTEEEEEEEKKKHHGDRESMDANPFDYVTDDPRAGHFAEKDTAKEEREAAHQ